MPCTLEVQCHAHSFLGLCTQELYFLTVTKGPPFDIRLAQTSD